MSPEDKIIEKIQKLLNLRKSANENEAALAAIKAQELLIKHNIDIASVENFKPEDDEPVQHIYHQVFNHNQILWKIDLATAIANANLCRILLSGNRLIWIGKKTNTDIALYLYETLERDLIRISEEHWNQLLLLRKMEIDNNVVLFTDRYLRTVHGKTWKNSFLLGAANTISKRLLDNLNVIRDTIDRANALVVVNDKALETYVAKTWPRLGKGKSRDSNIYGAAYKTGQKAGEKVNFSKGVGAGGSLGPKLIGGDK